MKAMLNDPSYEVGIYTKDGQVGTYSPYEDSRKMLYKGYRHNNQDLSAGSR